MYMDGTCRHAGPAGSDIIFRGRPYVEVEGCVVRSRRWDHWSQSFAVGCTYIGTVVGAGFASGQEIHQFFGRFGRIGLLTVAAATALFAVLGHRLLRLGWSTGARSYRNVNAMLFGRRLGPYVDAVLGIMLFGVIVVMLAGAGQLGVERAGVPFWAGVWWTMVCTWFTVVYGVAGVLRANVVIVPVMVGFVAYAGVHTLVHSGMRGAWTTAGTYTASPLLAAVSCLLYVAFNLGLASGVLVPVGSAMGDPAVLRTGARIGAAGLGAMLTAILYMLFAHAPAAFNYEVPMGYVAGQLGPVGGLLFTLALWGEIYTTLVGNLYALCAQLAEVIPWRPPLIAAVLLVLAQAFSQVGFAMLVAYAYTIFGVVALLILLALIWPRQDLPPE
jgi:uncharacterized membrane protein YkvI